MSRARSAAANASDRADRLREPDIERVALGAIVLDADVWRGFRDAGLRLDDFARPAHRLIFQAIAAADNDGLDPDVPTVFAYLRDAGTFDEVGAGYVTALPDGVPRPGPSNIEAIVQRLRRLAHARELYYATKKIGAELADDPNSINNGLLHRARELLDRIRDDADGTDARVSETLDDLAARVGDHAGRQLLVGDLFARGETSGLFGEERSMKTWASLDIMVACGTGQKAFGLLDVPEPMNVLVISNEDAPNAYLKRFGAILAGRGIAVRPPTIRTIIGQGASIDDPAWRERIAREVRMERIRLVFFDPLRSVTACTDQGPSEWRPAGDFLRRLATETGACVVPVHHLTKPSATGTDTRRPTHRVSGGGLVATIDAPILFERVDDTHALLLPHSFKHGPTPPPLQIALIADADLTTARITAEPTTVTAGATLAVQTAVLDYVRTNGGASGSAIAKAIRKDKAMTLAALRALADAGALDSVAGSRGAKFWFVRTTPETP